MRTVHAMVFALLLLVSARGAVAVCCECAGAMTPNPADLCSQDASFCNDGAASLCGELHGLFAFGGPGTVCETSELGELCGPPHAAPAPALSGGALRTLIGVLVLVGYLHIRRRSPS